MANPSYTANTAGNSLASQSLAASASVDVDIDLSAKFTGYPQVACTFGTVAATSGLKISVYCRVGTGPAVDTEALATPTISSTASTSKKLTIPLRTGKYRLTLLNLDATNGLTAVSVTTDTFDAVS
jgi:hypothetical protein